MFNLILADPNTELCKEWEKVFNYGYVDIHNDVFETVEKFQCMVSAANSYGLMDGGVDKAISNFFGWDLQKRVQKLIIQNYAGEQPVGTSMIVGTDNVKHPYIAHTPTMRTPTVLVGTDVPYVAMKAMLCEVKNFNETRMDEVEAIKTVVCPGLGTATGRVPAKVAAEQMALAYKHFLYPPEEITWDFATLRGYEIRNVI